MSCRQPWRLSIGWRTTTWCDRKHQQRPMCFGHELSTNTTLHFIWDIGHRSPASVMACPHWSVAIFRGLSASSCLVHITQSFLGVGCTHRSGEFKHGQSEATSVVACAHQTSNISKRHVTRPYKHQSWCVCIDSMTPVVAYAHKLGDIIEWKLTPYKSSMHHAWRVRINWVKLVVACMHWSGDVGQWHVPSTKVITNLMWFVHI